MQPPRPGFGMPPPGQRPGPVSGATSYPGAPPMMPRPMPHMMGAPPPFHSSPMPGAPAAMPFGAPALQARPPAAAQPAAGAAAPAWTEHTAPDGRKYYHNKATGKSSWERPADMGPAKARMQPPSQTYSVPYALSHHASAGVVQCLVPGGFWNVSTSGRQ